MKHLKKTLALVLASAVLLCGCAKSRAVTNEAEAAERLNLFLQDFAYSQKDTYDCILQKTLTQDGKTVYRMEAFWQTEAGERYTLGLFRVAQDGTVTVDSTATTK